MSESIKVQKVDNLVKVEMTISQGKFLALYYAIENHGTPTGNDLYNMISKAISDDDLKGI